MKELSIEEKARRYDKALARARNIVNSINVGLIGKDSFEAVFPELAESEDEKIRKDLIIYLRSVLSNKKYGDKFIESWIAWLENAQYAIDHAKREGFQLGYKAGIEKQDKKTEPIEDFVSEFEKQVSHLIASAINREHEYNKGYVKWAAQSLIEYAKREIEKQGEQKPVEWYREDEQNLNACLGYLPDEFLRRWLTDIIHVKYDKPVDKTKTRFKVGDWVVFKNKHQSIYQVEKIEDGYYILRHTHGGTFRVCVLHDESLRLWTIQDAKDGDVLCYKDEISLYKNDIKNCTKQETTFGGFVYHCCYDGKRFIMDSLYSLTEQDKMNIHPATKEQRDTLEKAITNAGYRWDKEKLKLEKV
jgi:uncharacterized protein YbgA (DUF1722 family)